MLKLFFYLVFFSIISIYSQTDDMLISEFSFKDKENENILPKKMIFTQRLVWGKKGLFRTSGISKLNSKNRQKEIKLRRKMLNFHQFVGYLTLAGMLAQGYIGGKLYNGDNSLYNLHKNMGKAVTISYFTGAGLSLFAPPPLVNKKVKGFSSIKAHKFLASIHFSAMVATNLLADKNKKQHKIAAYTAFTSYAMAILVFKF